MLSRRFALKYGLAFPDLYERDGLVHLDLEFVTYLATPAPAARPANGRACGGSTARPARRSGAGHDAVPMARVAPAAMIFVPCVGGISHNEIEDAKPADLTAGCNVLLNTVLEQANASTDAPQRGSTGA